MGNKKGETILFIQNSGYYNKDIRDFNQPSINLSLVGDSLIKLNIGIWIK